MYTGITLTGIGSAALIGGVGVFAADANQGSGYAALLIGAPLILGSTIFAGVGIPLWVLGARAPAESSAKSVSPAPTVLIAPSSVTMQWRF